MMPSRKANLSPTDNIKVYYKAAEKLVKIVEEFSEFIHSTVKQPLQQYPVPTGADVIITKTLPIKTDDLEITLAWGEGGRPHIGSGDGPSSSKASPSSVSRLEPAPQAKNGPPNSRFVNIILSNDLQSGQGRSGAMATIVLDNPSGTNGLSLTVFKQEVQSVFGLRGMKLAFYNDPSLKQALKEDAILSELAGKTVYVARVGGQSSVDSKAVSVAWPVCHYANVEGKGQKGTLMLENPRGDVVSAEDLKRQVSAVMNVPVKKLKLSKTNAKASLVCDDDLKNLSNLHGKTLYML